MIPKSLRLISVVAEKPARVPPKASGPKPLGSRSSVTGLVTPCRDSSPSTWYPSPWGFTEVEVKLIVLWFSTSRKSGERRWLSRVSSLVSTEARSMLALTEDARWSSPVVIWPWNDPKRPRTLLTII